MSITYLDAIRELQQRGLDALKAAGSTQLASLRASRDIVAAAGTSPPTMQPFVSAMSELTTSFTFALLEQQVAYAKKITESLVTGAQPPRPANVGAAATNVVEPAASAAQLATDESAQTASAGPGAQSPAQVRSAPPSFNDRVASAPIALRSEEVADTPTTVLAPDGATAVALGDAQDEILSKTLPAPKTVLMSANAARKSAKLPTVSNKRSPKPGSGKK